MKKRFVLFSSLFCLFSCYTSVPSKPYGYLDVLDSIQWKEDLTYLETNLPRKHPDLFHTLSEADFHRACAELDLRLSGLNADEILVELTRILASIGEGHTVLGSYPEDRYPFWCRWYEEGLYIFAADSRHPEIIGSRIEAVNGRSLGEVLPLLNSVIGVDHPNGYPVKHPQVLNNPRLMRGLGLADSTGLRLTLSDMDGQSFDTLVTASPTTTMDWRGIDRGDCDYSLSFTQNAGCWWDGDSETQTLYLRYDRCDSEYTPILNEVLEELKSGSWTRLIVDLRYNGGGDSRPGLSFIKKLAAIESINSEDALFVLISPQTFSSAMMNAIDFLAYTQARFAGQTLAEGAAHYGEVRKFTLPESELTICHSTRYFNYLPSVTASLPDGLLAPEPALEYVSKFANYRIGQDGLLETLLALPEVE